MKQPLHQITGVLLVGGKSRRMGQDKALLPIDGQPLVERIIHALQDSFSRLLLVGDRPERFADHHQLPVLPDIYPGSSLGGLYTGLYHAETDAVFVTSCDIPYPNRELIRLICAMPGSADAVIPATGNGQEPLFALYRKSCLPAMQAALEAGNYRITAVLQALQVTLVSHELLQQVDPGGTALLNLNTPEEYAACSVPDGGL